MRDLLEKGRLPRTLQKAGWVRWTNGQEMMPRRTA
jgi:hypothetical protein